MIVIIVPSRGRPKRARSMADSAMRTARTEIRLIVAVDPDDEALGEYRRKVPGVRVLPERLGYTRTLNTIAAELWDEDCIIGAFGDDVLFETDGWDRIVERTLVTPGIAFGDDLIHGPNHPTAVFMSSVIARTLGWLALPTTSHQWADDGWKRLGQQAGVLRYMPDVVVEHLHPAVQKAEWDDTYRSVFDDERAKSDYEGFMAWQSDGLERDVALVRSVL